MDMERSSDIDESCNIHQGFTLILSNVCLIHCKYPKKLPNKAGHQIIFRFIFCDLNQIVDFNHPQISTNIHPIFHLCNSCTLRDFADLSRRGKAAVGGSSFFSSFQIFRNPISDPRLSSEKSEKKKKKKHRS